MLNFLNLNFELDMNSLTKINDALGKRGVLVITLILSILSILSFIYFYTNGLGLAYNDARSHLDIGRRVVEGLKPGIAQLGSVWLPLPHALMIPTIWNDFFWHSGLSGALVSMISFVATGVLIFKFLKLLGVGMIGRLVAVGIFALNLNILYLQSTAMTELLLLSTMTAACYYFVLWAKTHYTLELLKAGFWVMLASLTRYDAWFLLFLMFVLIALLEFKKRDLARVEGLIIIFCTLAGFGIFLWLLWNQLIFKDFLYFALGPYSAHAQQEQLEAAGNLATKGNIFLSIKIYLLAVFYNIGVFTSLVAGLGAVIFWLDKRVSKRIKLASLVLIAPLLFNILALYLGHSVLFIQGISGNTWFNVRYGIMLIPSVAIFIGLLTERIRDVKYVLISLLAFITFFSFTSFDAVTIDDAKVGSSQKNVTEVSTWLKDNAKNQEGFVLISAASHDAIIFSSSLPMKKFIHEGTGKYWENATENPDKWARWIIMRTYDDNDSTYRLIKNRSGLENYQLVEKYPFADIYQLKEEYLDEVQTKPVFPNQK